MKFLVLCILTIIIDSCSYSVRYLRDDNLQIRQICNAPIYYSVDSGVKHRESVIDAADYWNVVLGKQLFVYDGTSHSAPVVISQIESFDNNDCGRAKIYSQTNGCLIFSQIDLKKKCLRNKRVAETLARHELGHILGLSNNDNPFHLMCEDVLLEKNHPIPASKSEIKALKEIY